MKLKLALLAITLSLCAAAQTTGLQTVGLIGDPNNPTIVNNSDKPIIATVVAREGFGDRPHVDRGLFLPPGSGMIPPGGQVPVLRALSTARVNGGKFVATQARVDLVVFADGTIMGEDHYNSANPIAARFAAIVKAGQMALAGQWADVSTMRSTIPITAPTDHDLRAYSYQLALVRNKQGSAAALRLANMYVALPTTFHR